MKIDKSPIANYKVIELSIKIIYLTEIGLADKF